VIAAETVNDPAMFDLYRKEVPATLVPFGGQFVGANLTVLEGEWPHPQRSADDSAATLQSLWNLEPGKKFSRLGIDPTASRGDVVASGAE
jgi:hypothetical protein